MSTLRVRANQLWNMKLGTMFRMRIWERQWTINPSQKRARIRAKLGLPILQRISTDFTERKSEKIYAVFVQSRHNLDGKERKRKSGIIRSPVKIFLLWSCFTMSGWSGPWKRCTGFLMSILRKISAALLTEPFSKIWICSENLLWAWSSSSIYYSRKKS